MNWLKNIEKKLKIYLNGLVVVKSLEYYALSKENPNVINIDCGQMPHGKAEQYIIEVATKLGQWYPDYKFVLLRTGR